MSLALIELEMVLSEEGNANQFFGAQGVYLGRRPASDSEAVNPDWIIVGNRGWRIDLSTYQLIHEGEGLVTVDAADPSVLLKSVLLEFEGATEEGRIVKRPRATWFEISKQLRKDPDFRFEFPGEPTAFEEFLAGAYHVDGWDAVTLTPHSGDMGRDVIAVTSGIRTDRVLDQAKAYSEKHLVPANDVRALLGVLTLDRLKTNHTATKGYMTTTSDFAPKVAAEFDPVIPFHLKLRNGTDLIDWVTSHNEST